MVKITGAFLALTLCSHHRALQTQFACKCLVLVQKCSGIVAYSLVKI